MLSRVAIELNLSRGLSRQFLNHDLVSGIGTQHIRSTDCRQWKILQCQPSKSTTIPGLIAKLPIAVAGWIRACPERLSDAKKSNGALAFHLHKCCWQSRGGAGL